MPSSLMASGSYLQHDQKAPPRNGNTSAGSETPARRSLISYYLFWLPTYFIYDFRTICASLSETQFYIIDFINWVSSDFLNWIWLMKKLSGQREISFAANGQFSFFIILPD